MTARLLHWTFLIALLLALPGCLVDKFFSVSRGGIQVQGRWPSDGSAGNPGSGLQTRATPDPVTTLTVTVTGQGLDQPLSQAVTRSSTNPESTFTLMFPSVPQGSKKVEASAYTASKALVARGNTDVTVEPGKVVEARITLVISSVSPQTVTVYVVSTLAGDGTSASTDGTGTNASFTSPQGLAIDSNGNLYVGDDGTNLIRKITSSGVVTTIAGSGAAGFGDGSATSAKFYGPLGIWVNGAGTLYIADDGNNAVRMIAGSTVSTLAGPGGITWADGTGSTARFPGPEDLVMDSSGTLYVADDNYIRKVTVPDGVTTTISSTAGDWGIGIDSTDNLYIAGRFSHTIRKVTKDGVATTIAGSGVAGYSDGYGAATQFNEPIDVTVDGQGNLFVVEAVGNRVRKITPSGKVTTVAGNGTASFADGVGTDAAFDQPTRIVMDSSDNLYVADRNNHRIRKLTPVTYAIPTVSTLAGSGTAGSLDGIGTSAQLNGAFRVTLDKSGNIYFTDNGHVRKIDPAGAVTTIAGDGTLNGFADGSGTAAKFGWAVGLAFDTTGNLYVVDNGNHRIRQIDPSNLVSTYTGGAKGSADGPLATARFFYPVGLASDSGGNLYVGDQLNQRVRKITPSGDVTTLAGSGAAGYADGSGAAALFNSPTGVAVDLGGNVYVADHDNHRIRKIDPSGGVTTVAGNGTAGFADGPAYAAMFNSPVDLALDSTGNIYVADRYNHRIRKVTPSGEVITLAGGPPGFADGPGTAARFKQPFGIAVDSSGAIYVADADNNRIRKIVQ